MINNSMIFLNKYLSKEIITANDNLSKQEFARELGVTVNCVKNGNDSIRMGDFVLIDNSPCIVHIVLPRDSLEIIAKKYNVSVEYIKEKNRIKTIFIGQQLFI